MTKTKIKLGVIIPTRGNRSRFLYNCWRMLNRQTLQPDFIELVNDTPLSDAVDITWRYRTGYDRLRKKGIDVIALIEDDDYYAADYLETMVRAWGNQGRPTLFGIDYSIYYHIGLKGHFRMNHFSRSPAMSTLIRPDLKIKWPLDHDPYTDCHLYTTIKDFKLWTPAKHICIGIKHGDGMTGGHQHVDRLHRYSPDAESAFLRATLDEESFKFYNTYFEPTAAIADPDNEQL